MSNLTNTVHKLNSRNVSLGLIYKTELSNHPIVFYARLNQRANNNRQQRALSSLITNFIYNHYLWLKTQYAFKAMGLKRECPRGPREITKMWHMLEKLISLIFC